MEITTEKIMAKTPCSEYTEEKVAVALRLWLRAKGASCYYRETLPSTS